MMNKDEAAQILGFCLAYSLLEAEKLRGFDLGRIFAESRDLLPDEDTAEEQAARVQEAFDVIFGPGFVSV